MKLAFRNDITGNLAYIDYGNGINSVAEIKDTIQAYHPDVSPNGKLVAFCTGVEGVPGTSSIYVRNLDASGSGLVKLNVKSAAIPRWRVTDDGDTSIVYVSSAANNKEDADFVACMEDILDVYQMPYDSKYPLWCMDEKPFQLLGEAREPLPMRPGDITKFDSDYKRNGTVSIFCFIQPHTGRIVHAVEPTRTAVDWAEKIRFLVDTVAPEAEKITLVMDNLNTHSIASLYKAFPPAEARRIARKLDVHYTPKHGSWLDIAEIGINIMTRECLNRRIPGIEELCTELRAWNDAYNEDPSPVNWQFSAADSRTKLRSLYPDIDRFRSERDERRKLKSQ